MGHVVDLKNNKSDVFERTSTFVRYCNDIKKFNILTPEQETHLFGVLCDESRTELERELARDKIINCNQRFVLAVAKRYATNDNLCDLIEEGNIGLIKSVNEFKKIIENGESKMYRFISIAVWYIKREINMYIINNGKQVKKSNNAKTYHTMSQAINKFYQREERNPTSEELLDILNDEYNVNIKDTYDLADLSIISINSQYDDSDDGDSFENDAYFTSRIFSSNDYETIENKEFNKFKTKQLLSKLTARDREIVENFFGVKGNKEATFDELSEKYGLTKERVRQIIKTSIKSMKSFSKSL